MACTRRLHRASSSSPEWTDLSRCDCWFETNSAIWTAGAIRVGTRPRRSRTGAACRACDRSHAVDARPSPSSHTRPRSACTRGVRDQTRQGCDSYAGAGLRSEGDSRGVSPFSAGSPMSLSGVRLSHGPLQGMFDKPASTGLEPDERLLSAGRARVVRHADDQVLSLVWGSWASPCRRSQSRSDDAVGAKPVEPPQVVADDAVRTRVVRLQ